MDSQNKSNVNNLRGDNVAKLKDIISELILIPGETLIAIVDYNGKKDRVPINTEKFKDFLINEFYKKYGKCPSNNDIKNAISIIKVECEAANRENLAYRINFIDGNILYDLHDPSLTYVEISPKGCEIKKNGYKYFMSDQSQKEQVSPILNSDLKDDLNSINLLDKYLNLSDDEKFLYKIWLISSMNPQIIVPITYFIGGHGTGKTSMVKILGELIDPGNIQMQNMDALSDKDIVIGLSKSFFTSYDNVSRIKQPRADILCQAITGGNQNIRKLYTDNDFCNYKLNCRVAISSIKDCIKTDDLAERTLFFHSNIINNNYKDEVGFWEEFNKDKAKILGGAFNILYTSLKHYPFIHKEGIGKNYRLASFNEFGFGVAVILGKSAGAERFTSLLNKNVYQQIRISPDNRLIIMGIVDLLDDKSHYELETRKLYDKLSMYINKYPGEKFDNFKLCNYDLFTKKLDIIQRNIKNFGFKMERTRTSTKNTSYLIFDRID